MRRETKFGRREYDFHWQEIDGRVARLEDWRSYLRGGAAVLSVLVGVLGTVILEWFFRR